MAYRLFMCTGEFTGYTGTTLISSCAPGGALSLLQT